MGVGRRVVAVVGSIAVLGLIPMTADPASSETAPSFHPLQPTRVMDTRSGQGGTQFASNETRYLQIAGVGGVPADAVAVALNVTVTGPTAPGYLTVWPAGSPVPTASNVNFLAGQTVANMVTTGLGPTGGVSIYNLLASAHVIVDVSGWFSAGFHPIRPSRAMDTREQRGGSALGSGETRQLPLGSLGVIPIDAVAVALNVTVTQPTMPSYLTVWPAGVSTPTASNLNFEPGQTVANMVTVGLGSGATVSLFNLAGTADVIVDVAGWYEAGFHPVVPGRIMDTRTGQCGFKMHADERREVLISGLAGVPSNGAAGVALNVTAASATVPSFLTLWPSGSSRPLASNLNVVPGHITANMALVGLGGSGLVSLYNFGGDVDVVIDVDGWFDGPTSSGATTCVVTTPQPPPAPAPTPTPTPAPTPVGFGDGTYLVGQQISPGRYQAPGGTGCYWERLSGFGGTLDEIIANDFGTTHVIVDIAPTDVGFHTDDCGRFVVYAPPVGASASFGDGNWVVNQQIASGTYSAPGGDSCYWERLRGFGGTFAEIIANDFGPTGPIVSISPSDGGFTSDGCGTWTRLGA